MSNITYTITLAGEWFFALDPNDLGVKDGWYKKELEGEIYLPGSAEENGYGEKLNAVDTLRLNRQYKYAGAAWYQRIIDIPKEWDGKKIALFMERCLWETKVWVDECFVGAEESLSTPHEYDLSGYLTPGTHVISVCVDNREKYRIGTWGHAYSDDMQSIWNGIIGKIELRAKDPIYIDNTQIYPDLDKKKVRIVVNIASIFEANADLSLSLNISRFGEDIYRYSQVVTAVTTNSVICINTEIHIDDENWLWDEFNPNLYQLQLKLFSNIGQSYFEDEKSLIFGMRKLETRNTQFVLNNRPIFLRGTLDCGSFPLTGYTAMDIDFWRRVYRIGKDYGLNHFRYHSWCPPEAAFNAADEEGIILQIELPFFPLTNKQEEAIFSPDDCVPPLGSDADREQFFCNELDKILDIYGNHPSFCLMCMGNELKGDYSYLKELVKRGKSEDTRHLYTTCANNSLEPSIEIQPYPGDEFYVSHAAIVNGLRSDRRCTDRFNKEKPETISDYTVQQKDIDMPVLSHEIGQWLVYPNFDEMKKYKGLLKPLNFQFFKDSLEAKGLGDQAGDFMKASGKLSALLYREEIERSLRTLDYGGFQLLDIHDYHGQGSSTIGILDAFWDSKGLISPEEFRGFCGPLVLLARMKQRVWTNNDSFCADIDIANYTKNALVKDKIHWKISYANGTCLFSGCIDEVSAEQGRLTRARNISVSLNQFKEAVKLIMKLEIENKEISNKYEFWVYPNQLQIQNPCDIMVCNDLNDTAEEHLKKGGKVLLLPEENEAMDDIRYTTVFWNTQLFENQKKSMGILCRPNHPVFDNFPTECHTNWQWWELLHQAKCMVLNNTPKNYRPILQVIDHPMRNNKQGIIFEAKRGQGKVLVCTLQLTKLSDQSIVARQLLYSLTEYMKSQAFEPSDDLTEEFWKDFKR